VNRVIGGKKGWRLPSIHELGSLIDASQTNPALPFGNVKSDQGYWSATTDGAGPNVAWAIGLGNGYIGLGDKTWTGHVWCVRGGMNADRY
jgi:Protein of unknown function (DUF1566)